MDAGLIRCCSPASQAVAESFHCCSHASLAVADVLFWRRIGSPMDADLLRWCRIAPPISYIVPNTIVFGIFVRFTTPSPHRHHTVTAP